jgi:hypothetical protein
VLADAATVLPESAVFRHRDGVAKGSLATFSNIFRYELLYTHGGWWADLDMVAVSADWPSADIVLARQDANLINCAVLKFPATHAAMAEARARCAARLENPSWTELGPQLVSELVTEGRIPPQAVLPAGAFYPLHYSQFWNVLDPRRTQAVTAACAGAHGVHLWNEMFRRFGLEKDVLPPAGSWLRRLYERTLDLASFTREYRLKRDCRENQLDLELISRGNDRQTL